MAVLPLSVEKVKRQHQLRINRFGYYAELPKEEQSLFIKRLNNFLIKKELLADKGLLSPKKFQF